MRDMGQTNAEPAAGVHVCWAGPAAPPVDAPCRTCGEPGPKPVLLDADADLPGQGTRRVRLLDCPRCGCAFAEALTEFDYTDATASETNVAHYVEVGAGPWKIIRTIARLFPPPGAKYLEIGCGFGFGLDYAIAERGWDGRGIDPSPFAAAGRAALGLPIESRYFRADEAPGTAADVILASEVLEHVADPLPFLRTLRSALAPGGALALTTPNRARLAPGVPLPELVPILSVGAHLVLQTEGSLRQLLRAAGFEHVHAEVASPDDLFAYASDAPLRLAGSDDAPRRSYRAYLVRRAGTATPGSSVWWGMQARAYQEAVAVSDWPEAGRIWPTLLDACRTSHGIDPDDPVSVPDTTGLSLPGLRGRVPGPLPNLLYLRALHRLNGPEPWSLSATESLLRAAARTARDLTAALRPLAAEDQAILSVERAALSMLAASLADRADPGALPALAAAVAADPAHATATARRCFVGLVNAGQTDLARQVESRWDLDAAALDAAPPGRPLDASERDALFCLAMLDLAPPPDLERARRRFARVRAAGPADPLYWPALRGECFAADQSGDAAHVNALLAALPPRDMPADLRQRRPPGVVRRLAMLALRVPRRLSR